LFRFVLKKSRCERDIEEIRSAGRISAGIYSSSDDFQDRAAVIRFLDKGGNNQGKYGVCKILRRECFMKGIRADVLIAG